MVGVEVKVVFDFFGNTKEFPAKLLVSLGHVFNSLTEKSMAALKA
jgi:hypothetical protein